MEDIKDLANRLFNAAGLKYEILMYKQYRDAQRKSYKGGLPYKPAPIQEELDSMEENENLTTLKQVMEHAAEIKRLTKG